MKLGRNEHDINIKEQSMAKGFAVLSVASIAVKIMSLVFIPLIRQLMGGFAGYQVYYSANQIFAFVYVLATAGLPVAISKIVSERIAGEDIKGARRAFTIARNSMAVLGLALTVILIAAAKPLAASTGYPDSWLGIVVIAPNVLICSILSAYRGYLQGLKNMTPTAVSQVVEQLVHLAVSIIAILILRDRGIVWAVAGASLGTVAGAIVALVIVWHYYKNDGRTRDDNSSNARAGILGDDASKKLFRLLVRYSVPITLSAAIQYGGNMIDVFIVKSRLVASGLDENAAEALHGELSAARQLINVPTALVTALCISLLPIIAGLYYKKRFTDATAKANYAFGLCFAAAVPCTVAMCVFARPIYKALAFGDGFQILMYMSISVLLIGIVHLQCSVMQSVNLLYPATVFIAIGVVVKAILNYVLIAVPSLNIYGAVISTYVSYLVPMVLNAYMLNKARHMRIRIVSTLFPSLLSSALMLVISVPAYLILYNLLSFTSMYAANIIAFAIAAVIAVVTYVIAMKHTGGLTKADVSSISPRLASLFHFT